jgi:hypothetical protein
MGSPGKGDEEAFYYTRRSLCAVCLTFGGIPL